MEPLKFDKEITALRRFNKYYFGAHVNLVPSRPEFKFI